VCVNLLQRVRRKRGWLVFQSGEVHYIVGAKIGGRKRNKMAGKSSRDLFCMCKERSGGGLGEEIGGGWRGQDSGGMKKNKSPGT